MNTSLKSLLIAAAALTAVSSYAQDKATLDLLVKKGLITAEERAKTLDEASQARATSGVNRVFPKEDTTKRLTISGYFQTQYENYGSSSTTNAGVVSDKIQQSNFIMRRLYLELLADVGEGISGNVVLDMSGNTASSSTSSLDRAILTLSSTYGNFDFGYKKATWGYEESTLSSLFKASSSRLITVERGITNRYWNEAENGRRLGFGAHHTGLFYSTVANPNGFEFGAAVTNANRDFTSAGKGQNDLAYFANIVWNNKVSDNEKYAVGVNYGHTPYFDAGNTKNTAVTMSGYNPFVQAQYFNWTAMAEYFNTKFADPVTATNDGRKPTGYNATVAYKINDNWEGVLRYTDLNTDGRGQKISDGVRDYDATTNGVTTTYDKSNSWYLGVNYFFTLSALNGSQYNGHNAKIQLGWEKSKFTGSTHNVGAADTLPNQKADVDTVRLQAQVAF